MVENINGKYRVRKMIDGKRYCKTFDKKPLKKDIDDWVADIRNTSVTLQNAPKTSFMKCAREYLSIKENVLSPSTLRSYDAYLRTMPTEFTEKNMRDIDQIAIQKLVNDMSVSKSPKTIRNYHAFISAVMSMFMPNMRLNTTLPQKVKDEPYIPTSDEVKKVMEQATIEKYRILFMLGCYGLRRSEAICISADDLDGNILHINKALVLGMDGQWEMKSNKTYESTRDVPISSDLADDIRKIGKVYDGHPSKILIYLNRCQDKAGVPHFKFHALRHFFVTELSQANVPEADILKLGGYSTPNVMKQIYRHSRIQNEEDKQQEIANKIRALI